MLLNLPQRKRFAAAALFLLLVTLICIHAQRAGTLFGYLSRSFRCRECGMIRKETELDVLGVTLFQQSHFAETKLSELLNAPPNARCQHWLDQPIRWWQIRCTTESFPRIEVVEPSCGDAGGFPENEGFLQALATINRTNPGKARSVWMALSRLDYRSSNRVTELYTSLDKTNIGEVLAIIQSEPSFHPAGQ